MRLLLLLSIVLSIHPNAQAQFWAHPGAEWTVGVSSAQSATNGFRHFQYTGDTLYQGMNAQHIAVDGSIMLINWSGTIDTIYHSQYDRYTSVQNEVVLLYVDSLAIWDTLYWYGSIGDRWYPPGFQTNCHPQGQLMITDISTVVWDGVALLSREVSYLDDQGIPMQYNWPMLERVGIPTWVSEPLFLPCNLLTDIWPILHIRCYSDNDISHSEASPTYDPDQWGCIGFIGIDEQENARKLNLSPNPGMDHLNIQLPPPFRSGTIAVYDAMGGCVYARTIKGGSGDSHAFDASALASGSYQILLMSDSGTSWTGTWLKE